MTAPNLAHVGHSRMDLPPSTLPTRRKVTNNLWAVVVHAVEYSGEDAFFTYTQFSPSPRKSNEIRPFFARPVSLQLFGRMVQQQTAMKQTKKVFTYKTR